MKNGKPSLNRGLNSYVCLSICADVGSEVFCGRQTFSIGQRAKKIFLKNDAPKIVMIMYLS